MSMLSYPTQVYVFKSIPDQKPSIISSTASIPNSPFLDDSLAISPQIASPSEVIVPNFDAFSAPLTPLSITPAVADTKSLNAIKPAVGLDDVFPMWSAVDPVNNRTSKYSPLLNSDFSSDLWATTPANTALSFETSKEVLPVPASTNWPLPQPVSLPSTDSFDPQWSSNVSFNLPFPTAGADSNYNGHKKEEVDSFAPTPAGFVHTTQPNQPIPPYTQPYPLSYPPQPPMYSIPGYTNGTQAYQQQPYQQYPLQINPVDVHVDYPPYANTANSYPYPPYYPPSTTSDSLQNPPRFDKDNPFL